MSDGKMKSFKVQDAVKKQVDRPRGKVAPVAAEPVSSAGFPKIEALVESPAPDVDLAELEVRRSQLQELAKASKSQKEKLAFQRAQKGYEKARALIESLLATKTRMAQGTGT